LKINFFEKKAEDIEKLLVDYYEQMVGPCGAGSPQRGFTKTIVYLLFTFGKHFNSMQKQNLLRYASGDYLDALGEFRGNIERLKDTKAVTTLKFNILETQIAVTVSKGFKVASLNGVLFETKEDLTFNPLEREKEVIAECMESGELGNGFLPGQINKLVDINSFIVSVENSSTSQGGAEIEGDEAFRERIRTSPESLSVAGPRGAYRSIALGVSPQISDVYVGSSLPGIVEIKPLMKGGDLPDSAILSEIQSACSDRTVRPLTDSVQTSSPTVIHFNLDIDYYVSSLFNSDIEGSKRDIEEAIDRWELLIKSRLGRDINPDDLVRDLKNVGAKRVVIREPSFTILSDDEVGIVNTKQVSYMGVEDEKDN